MSDWLETCIKYHDLRQSWPVLLERIAGCEAFALLSATVRTAWKDGGSAQILNSQNQLLGHFEGKGARMYPVRGFWGNCADGDIACERFMLLTLDFSNGFPMSKAQLYTLCCRACGKFSQGQGIFGDVEGSRMSLWRMNAFGQIEAEDYCGALADLSLDCLTGAAQRAKLDRYRFTAPAFVEQSPQLQLREYGSGTMSTSADGKHVMGMIRGALHKKMGWN